MKLSTQILLAFSIILSLSVIDSYTNYLLSTKVEKNTKFLERSESVIRNSARLHRAIIEMQSAVRGFLLTGDSNFLETYDVGISDAPALFKEQRSLVLDNKNQLAVLDSISDMHKRWIDYSGTLIDARKKVDISEAYTQAYDQLFVGKFKKQVGQKINDSIAIKFSDFDKSEYRLRSARAATLISSINRTHTVSFIFLSLTVIVGIVSTIYIVRLISKRIKQMVNLSESISRGEFVTVKDTKNDELTRLTDSLNIMSGKLQKNISELEKRNEELDKFAYVVSHDLKAPLRGIHNVIKWIEEDIGNELSPQMKNYLSIIPERTNRMEDLINGLLEYARIRQKANLEKTNVNKLVKDITDAIVPDHFKVSIHPLPIFDTERLKLEQVFTNLISNSVKYMHSHSGDKVISIDCKELGNQYEFSVKDNGTGIDPEYHEKIFEIFQTLREKNEKSSTGIGLAIIRKIIEDQHCTIKVNSAVGRGAEFVFTWPKANPV